MITERVIEVRDYVTKSNLPASDYVINPYVGCPHACKYCYACFMKRFSGHREEWGEFIDIKRCDKPVPLAEIKGKTVFLSSVTDCYNKYEEKYGITRKILEQLVSADCDLNICTKSKLILRDADLLKQCRRLKVSVSVNTLDEEFKNHMDKASSIRDRLLTLEELHGLGIRTVLFMSPIFPYITDYQEIIEKSSAFVDEYWFEDLNLRGGYKQKILSYIASEYPQFHDAYRQIYLEGKKGFWSGLAMEIREYCEASNINYVIYFYHARKQ
ncbi:MAG: radical SAM protein [Clostridium sp.]|nr:radical SAM protein [Clostridium sp.]